MSKTKIKAALSALEKAAKGAFKVLNDVADGTYEGSPAEADPVKHAHEISQRLHKELDQIETRAAYEGLSEQEIAEKKASELAAIRARQAREAAEKLKALKPKPAEPEPDTDEDADDQEDDPVDPVNPETPADPETKTDPVDPANPETEPANLETETGNLETEPAKTESGEENPAA